MRRQSVVVGRWMNVKKSLMNTHFELEVFSPALEWCPRCRHYRRYQRRRPRTKGVAVVLVLVGDVF